MECCSHTLPCGYVEAVVVETHYKIIERVDELPERAHPFSIAKTSVAVEFGCQGGRSRRDEKTSIEPMSRLLHG